MRLIQVDILRAVAVLLVMGAHLPVSLFERQTPLTGFLSVWLRCGWTGVDLFFVLSGFLVSGLLFGEYKARRRVDLARFLVRRGLKIYPGFYVFLLLTTLYLALAGLHFPSLRQYVGEIFYFQNYGPHIWEHTWSLAVEEHFYLFIGALILYLSKRQGDDPFRVLVLLCGCLGGAILALRIWNACLNPYTHQTHLFPTHLRIDSLLFGVLLSYCHHFHHDTLRGFVRAHKRGILALSAALLSTSLFWTLFDPFMHAVGFTLLYLGFGGVLAVAVHGVDPSRVTAHAPVQWLARVGVCSYAIYLWHIVMARGFPYGALAIPRHYFLSSCVTLAVYVGGAVGLGIVMAHAIEIPVLKYRDMKIRSNSGSLS